MMTPYEIILKKKLNKTHTKEEIEYIVTSYIDGEFTDYQMTAWLMSVYFNGMVEEEMINYTNSIIDSGTRINWNDLNGFIVDKHSTGGVGDKVSIALAPILAACGCYVPMVVGRALGHTGGTLDKLESIPNYNAMLSLPNFKRTVKNVGCSIIGQIPEICPADLKIYNLRDQTSTIDSFPLICGSIMSKKIAEGIEGLILDIKVGNGAFMKNISDAKTLAGILEKVAKKSNVKINTIFSDMNQILGNSAGLFCEVLESISILEGKGPSDLTYLIKEIAVKCLELNDISNPLDKINASITSGAAYDKFFQMLSSHGVELNWEQIKEINKPKYAKSILSEETGYLHSMDAFKIGMNLIEIGAGRKSITDSLDYTAGVTLYKKVGDYISKGDEIGIIYNSINKKSLIKSHDYFRNCFNIASKKLVRNSQFLIIK